MAMRYMQKLQRVPAQGERGKIQLSVDDSRSF